MFLAEVAGVLYGQPAAGHLLQPPVRDRAQPINPQRISRRRCQFCSVVVFCLADMLLRMLRRPSLYDDATG
jgi:hypothetical protein